MRQYFGTDGVRGVANENLTADLALRIGSAAAKVLSAKPHGVKVLIGRDPRISGDMLESALAAGFASRGADVILVGVIPTPGVAYLVQQADADFGAVISASHNSVEYNGIKFFGPDGEKLPDDTERLIEQEMERVSGDKLPTGVNVGRFFRRPERVEYYINAIKSSCRSGLDGMRIVVDGSNGAAYDIGPRALRELGAKVVAVHCSPDGENINDGCGSIHPEKMLEMVKLEGADVGLAFDGDADRVMLGAENGELVDGDKVMAILGIDLKSRGELPGNRVVATVMSNMGLEQALERNDIILDRTDVGDRYVAERMRETGALIGGEKSGHIILSKYTTTGDGIVTAIQVLDVMRQTGKTLSELASVMVELPQVLDGVKVREKNGWADRPSIRDAIHGAQDALRGRGRINVRASGTEPLIRVMAEGPDETELKIIVGSVCDTIRQEIGA